MSLAVLILIVGSLALVENYASFLLRQVNRLTDVPRVDWLPVVDGEAWWQVLGPQVESIGSHHRLRVRSDHPGVMINDAIRMVDSEYVAFLWPGCDPKRSLRSLGRLLNAAEAKNLDAIAGPPSLGERRGDAWKTYLISWEAQQRMGLTAFHKGWLQMLDLVPMSNCVMRKDMIAGKGGFSRSTLHQRLFWWNFCLRAAVDPGIEYAGPPSSLPSTRCLWGWHNFPFETSSEISGDFASRIVSVENVDRSATAVVLGSFDETARARVESQIQRSHFDISMAEGSRPAVPDLAWAVPGLNAKDLKSWKRPLRVTILGGPYEPAHNRLCFLNYFELLEKQNLLNWRIVLDSAAQRTDVANCDLVIFSRVRSRQGVELIEFCQEIAIPTLYMLDDNWFALGQESEEFRDIFSPGRQTYENFVRCCKLADATLVYSKWLEDDIREYSKKVYRIRSNVKLTHFARNQGDCPPVTVAYAGSSRGHHLAMEALSVLLTRRSDTRAFLMCPEFPAALRNVEADRVRWTRYVPSYERYSRTISAVSPHIMLAPLGRTRWEGSKCPNKYLEITAAGAAGIYSDVEPYSSFVENERTGLLVANEEKAWVQACELLADRPLLRKSIVDNAYSDVAMNYSTESVLDEFVGVLLSVLGWA